MRKFRLFIEWFLTLIGMFILVLLNYVLLWAYRNLFVLYHEEGFFVSASIFATTTLIVLFEILLVLKLFEDEENQD